MKQQDKIEQLIEAAEAAEDALCDVVNAEYSAGNEDFEDVKYSESVLDKLQAALNAMKE